MVKVCANEHCGKEFIPYDNRQKFCSQSCAAKVNNLGVRRNGKSPGNCVVCGKRKSRHKSKYCSNKCYQTYVASCKIDLWLSGKWSGSIQSTGELSSTVRDYLLKVANGKCSKCGWGMKNEYTNVVPLQIHHIDGNYRNNSPENLVILCPNCHSLTENFGGRQRKYIGNSRRKN